jgi:ATP-dependent DNA helicase RecQ
MDSAAPPDKLKLELQRACPTLTAVKSGTTNLLPLLKQYFGFTSFRPLQEEIIRDALAGKDVFALLPTGGGKSLCFQLPAMVQPGLTVVVSPLIALMKDQVDGMQAGGIPATFLNSSLAQGESRARLRGLHNGEFRLLYVAPERLMLSGFLSDLQRWNVRLLAVDEAHCISEWGHDFRPEYRQLAELRKLFPETPMMALTATATERVRADIVKLLELREPRCYVASFNRPNLTYRVLAKNKPYDQVLEFVRARPKESGIVYCQSRKSAESVALRLNEDGVKARPYHAGLTPKERSEHQELFLRDDVRVICATIAFGMGINKPNVRFVIHYDLPKNIEGYYQETGRAGRDGLPGECVLLFSAGDVVKQTQFIDEKPDPKEQQIAREQLQKMVHYAECSGCRRRELLAYFGEEFSPIVSVAADGVRSIFFGRKRKSEPTCIGCYGTRELRRVRQLPYAARHVRRHARRAKISLLRLSHPRENPVWRRFEPRGRGPDRRGHGEDSQVESRATLDLRHRRGTQPAGMGGHWAGTDPAWPFAANVREIQRAGTDGCRAGRPQATPEPVTLTKPVTAPEPKAHRAGEIACDEVLFDRLRRLRKQLADERNVPAYIVFSDVALRQMARDYPASEREFARITGVGEKKLREFGDAFLAEIAAHVGNNPRQIFADDSFAAPSGRR